MLINRVIKKDIQEYLLKKGKKIIILYGPRQSGKTTLINLLFKETKTAFRYFSGDDLYAHEILSKNELEKLRRTIASDEILFVDEAQKIKNIGLTFKLLYDNIGVSIIASGSSSFDLANKLSEPLTGRTKTFMLYPLSFEEAKEKFKNTAEKTALEQMLRFGMYPKIHTLATEKEKEDYIVEYVSKYLYNDILEFSGIKKPKKVIDLLSLLALQAGSEVSVAELAQNLALSQKAVENYLDILEKMFVIVNLRGFSRNLRKEISKTSKYYFVDTGLRNALIRNFNPLEIRSDTGALFENFFIMEKIKLAENSRESANFYFWRTYDQKEIDLIEERAGKLTGYECKWSAKKSAPAPLDWKRAYPEAEFKTVNPENYKEFLLDNS
jgi:uncharacterized protein